MALVLALALSACGAPPDDALVETPDAPAAGVSPSALPPTPLPTPEPQPAASRLTLLLPPLDVSSPSADDAAALGDLLGETADASVEVVVDATNLQAFEALCAGTASAALLHPFTAVAAQQEGCGEPVYVLESDGVAYRTGQIVAPAGEVASVVNLPGRVVCRRSAEDTTGWAVPVLGLRAEGIDPLAMLAGVEDLGSDDAVLGGLLDGTCEAGIVAMGAADALDDPAAIDVVLTLPSVPDGVLMVANEQDPGSLRALLTILRDHRGEIAELVGADGLLAADAQDIAPLLDLFNSAGVNPAIMAK